MSYLSDAYLLSKVGGINPSTRAKALEIIHAAHAAGHRIRFVWGMGSSEDHRTGDALDIMIFDNAAGDWVRNYVWSNRARLRLKHVIWEQSITSTVVQPGVRRHMADRGNATKNHFDHNHIRFLDHRAYVAPAHQVPTPSKPPTPAPRKSNYQIAAEVVAGKWGNGADRVKKLTAAGYNAKVVQALVEQQLAKPAKKSVHTIATEVVAGKWGNGTERVRRLKAAGYDPKAVQAEVNRLV